MEYHVFWLLKNFSFKPSRNGKYGKPKNWWKDDIYWLLKSSCFKIFEDGKYGLLLAKELMEKWYSVITGKSLFWTFWRWGHGLFWAKKLMERWYFLGLFELFMIFQDLGNMVFCAVLKTSYINGKTSCHYY